MWSDSCCEYRNDTREKDRQEKTCDGAVCYVCIAVTEFGYYVVAFCFKRRVPAPLPRIGQAVICNRKSAV